MNKNSSFQKLVILDFCETLIKFQTADRFIDFVCVDKNIFLHKLIFLIQIFLKKIKFTSIIYKFFPKFNFNKRLKLLSIIGIDRKYLNLKAESYNKILIDNIILEMQEILNESLKNNDNVIIVSGGYEIYLSEFSNYHKIKNLIGTKIMFRNNKATGLVHGLDCMHENKVILLENYIKKNNIKYNTSVVYSDSISDIPLFKWADKGYVISKGSSQNWVKSYDLNEIIWND
tara:strand:+ start:1035 stop:1724 length:690 start_codon:yes stop_codon:yes gene_type:complete